MKADLVIDAKGLACPMPIVRTKKRWIRYNQVKC